MPVHCYNGDTMYCDVCEQDSPTLEDGLCPACAATDRRRSESMRIRRNCAKARDAIGSVHWTDNETGERMIVCDIADLAGSLFVVFQDEYGAMRLCSYPHWAGLYTRVTT